VILSITLYRTYRAKRKPDKVETGNIAICVFLILGSAIGILGHYWLCLVFMCAAALFGYVLRPDLQEKERDKTVKTIKNDVDTLEPLRVRDFFSARCIPKLERRYSEPKAQLIYLTICTSLAIVVCMPAFFLIYYIFINSTLPISIWYGTIIITISTSVITSRNSYLNIKKALKNPNIYNHQT